MADGVIVKVLPVEDLAAGLQLVIALTGRQQGQQQEQQDSA